MMNRCVRWSAGFVMVAVLAARAAPTLGRGSPVPIWEKVPVERLVKNLEEHTPEKNPPGDAHGAAFHLARLHAMAYALKTDTVEVQKNQGRTGSAFLVRLHPGLRAFQAHTHRRRRQAKGSPGSSSTRPSPPTKRLWPWSRRIYPLNSGRPGASNRARQPRGPPSRPTDASSTTAGPERKTSATARSAANTSPPKPPAI